MTTLASAPDIPLIIVVPSDDGSAPPQIQSERRINQSWTFEQFKTKMEPITGVPPGSMRVVVRGKDVSQSMGEDEPVGKWSLGKGESIQIYDSRPPALRQSLTFDPNAPDAAPKYVMPASAYETRNDSVLAWKKANKLGRFDPTAPTASDLEKQRHERDTSAIEEKQISKGQRCRVGGSDARRGEVRYVGPIPEIEKEKGAVWVGVAFDEPVGKNDGSIAGKAYFETNGTNFGAFARPENVEVGDQFNPINDLLDEDMEEI